MQFKDIADEQKGTDLGIQEKIWLKAHCRNCTICADKSRCGTTKGQITYSQVDIKVLETKS